MKLHLTFMKNLKNITKQNLLIYLRWLGNLIKK
jgi:hypothetical protein